MVWAPRLVCTAHGDRQGTESLSTETLRRSGPASPTLSAFDRYRLSKGDADILRFLTWAEFVESDLWTQYNALGGATKPNDGAVNTGNPAYILALQNLDGDMPQYITDNTDDELSHAAFLNVSTHWNGISAGRALLKIGIVLSWHIPAGKHLLSLATWHLYLLSLHFYRMLLRLDVRAVSIRVNLGELCTKKKNLRGIVDPQE